MIEGNGSDPRDIDLDEDFPLGDGTAGTAAIVVCPYCSETVTVEVDPGGGSVQKYVEDCEVCCNPWDVTVRFLEGIPEVTVTPIDQ